MRTPGYGKHRGQSARSANSLEQSTKIIAWWRVLTVLQAAKSESKTAKRLGRHEPHIGNNNQSSRVSVDDCSIEVILLFPPFEPATPVLRGTRCIHKTTLSTGVSCEPCLYKQRCQFYMFLQKPHKLHHNLQNYRKLTVQVISSFYLR